MSYQEFLSFERRGAVGIVRLARPEKLNTISAPFYEAMIELQQTEIVGDHDLRAIALLADGRHFSAGIDLNYAKAVIGKPGRSLYGVYHWQQAYRFWSECNLPVVVGIQGACMGTAIELITACDIRIAADNAKFSLREVDVGISTDLGGTTRLTKLIGPGMTKLLAMTCEDIDAQEAARIRLVERVVPLGELEQTTPAYAEKLAAKPPIAVQMCKKCINIATDAGTSVGLLAEEIQGIYTVSTKDKAEAAVRINQEETSMNILVINGSPRMERSNSLRMTRAFLEGLAKTCDTQVEELTVAKMHIEPCLGCLNCWKRTPGKCFRDDDMAAAIESYVTADLVVWSFPLYYYALPGQLKCFLDRTVPINRPVMCDRTDGKGNGKHVTRYDQSHQRHVLISTCGFFSPKGNYDAVLAQFDLMLGVGNYTTLFCGEGEMMPVPPLQERVEEYLGYVRHAGEDYGSYGTILPKTRKPLEELLLPKEKFEEMGNSYYAHCERKARERALQAQAEQQT